MVAEAAELSLKDRLAAAPESRLGLLWSALVRVAPPTDCWVLPMVSCDVPPELQPVVSMVAVVGRFKGEANSLFREVRR